MYGKTHSDETKHIMKLAKLGDKNYLWGKNLSDEVKLKLSIAKGTTIYIYSSDGKTLINTFSSARKASEFFGTNHHNILNHAKNKKIFKEQWLLSNELLN